MFNKQAGGFYGGIKPLGLVAISPYETRHASLLNDFKNIPGNACLNRVDNNVAFVNVGN